MVNLLGRCSSPQKGRHRNSPQQHAITIQHTQTNVYVCTLYIHKKIGKDTMVCRVACHFLVLFALHHNRVSFGVLLLLLLLVFTVVAASAVCYNNNNNRQLTAQSSCAAQHFQSSESEFIYSSNNSESKKHNESSLQHTQRALLGTGRESEREREQEWDRDRERARKVHVCRPMMLSK